MIPQTCLIWYFLEVNQPVLAVILTACLAVNMVGAIIQTAIKSL